MATFKAVLFDLDGTLASTLPDLCTAVNAMRHDMNLGPLPDDTVATYVGKGVRNLVARSLDLTDTGANRQRIDQACERFRQHYNHSNGTQSELFPGVLEGLHAFRAQGSRLAIVTNKAQEFTDPLLQQLQLESFFDVVICGDTCARKKPDPMPVLHACTLLESAPAHTLFIGDSIYDARAAKAAGTRLLLLPYGYNEARPVTGLGADAIVQSIHEAALWAAQHHD